MKFNKEIAVLTFDRIIYFSIIFLPFSIAIAIAPMNIFAGFLIVSFLIKKSLLKESPFINTGLNLALVLLLAVTSISVINSIDLQDSLKGGIFKLLRYIIIFFILSQEIKDKRHIKWITTSIIFGMVLISLDGIWQVLRGSDFIRGYLPVVNIGLVRATASFKDSNNMGIYLSAFFPIIFGLTLFYFKLRLKIIMIGASAISLAGIMLTYSRPTLLAVFIAVAFFALAKRNKLLSLLLIALILASPFILPRSFKQWAKQMGYNPIRVMCNDDRIAIFRNSINMIQAHPIIGVGANTFMKNYKYYKESPEYRGIITSDYVYAHNNFLHMAAEIGLIGLGVFLWMLYKIFLESRRIYLAFDDKYLKIISLSLTASLIAFLVNGLSESSLYSSRVAILFWYIIGFIFAQKNFTKRPHGC